MLRGDFEQAYEANDRLRDRNSPDEDRFWQREPIAGKRLILRSLHGFGDAIQYLRFLPLLNATAAAVTVEVTPRLAPLIRHLHGAQHVITWDDPPPPWDIQAELMELPYLLRVQPADLPGTIPYLHLPTPAPLPFSGKLRVGLACSAGAWNPSRALPEALLGPLLATPGCDFWNLSPHPPSLPLRELPAARTDLLTLVGVVQQLDLVITGDTFAAHLAGALGVPAFVLLQHAADWRWQHLRPDTPWYPTLRLFRQPAAGDWLAVIEAARVALSAQALR